ncbi:hypothetical protein sphantq_04763 (plasmid) [Sphingobium sp. AntQ-1]|nr:hypothetical protein sphantq_04763 [Sphingobium sp. AntQ-1]
MQDFDARQLNQFARPLWDSRSNRSGASSLSLAPGAGVAILLVKPDTSGTSGAMGQRSVCRFFASKRRTKPMKAF